MKKTGKKDQMSPQDTRNLFIFMIVALVLYLSYEYFILQPQQEALRAMQSAKMEQPQAQSLDISQTTEKPDEILGRDEALNVSRRIKIDNDKITGSLTTTGGRIDDIALDEYFDTLKQEENVKLFSPKGTDHPRYADYGWVAENKATKVPNADTIWRVEGAEKLTPDSPLTLKWTNGQGLTFTRTIALDEHYVFQITQSVENNSGAPVKLFPYGLIAQTAIPADYQKNWLVHEGPIGYVGKKLMEISYSALSKKGAVSENADQGWIGITDKYWLSALIPPQGQTIKYAFNIKPDPKATGAKGEKPRHVYQTDYLAAPITIASGQSVDSVSYMYVGAKKLMLLNKYEDSLSAPNLNLAVNFGWFWFFSKPFFYALHYIGGFLGNFGLGIIIITIIIRSMVFPLTNASYRSFGKMKKVTPQIVELRDQYKDDKQKLQEELVKLYQKEGVNPMAGCLPMILQIPIFFALYKVLFVTIEVRHAPFFGWIEDLSAKDPTNVFELFGLAPWDAPSFLHIGAWPCFMLIALVIQKQLNPPPQDPIQRDMTRIFPFMMVYIMGKFAAGLVIYWTFSALIGLIQQIIIMRSMGIPIHLFGQTADEKKLEEQVEEGPPAHPLVDMVEDDFEDAMFGPHDNADDKPKNAKDAAQKKKISPPKPKKSKKKK